MDYDLTGRLSELAEAAQQPDRDCPVSAFLLTTEADIARYAALKAAQPPGSEHYTAMREEYIEPLTQRWLVARMRARPLSEVNGEIAGLRQERREMELDASRVIPRYFKAAAALAVLGAGLLLFGAAFGLPFYLWLVMAGALVGAGILTWYGMRARGDINADLADVAGEVTAAQQRRAQILPRPDMQVGYEEVLDVLVHGLNDPWLDCPVCATTYTPEVTIARLNALKSAQDEDTDYARTFQHWIDQVTTYWRQQDAGGTPIRTTGGPLGGPPAGPPAGGQPMQATVPRQRGEEVPVWQPTVVGSRWLRPAGVAGVVGAVLVVLGAGFGLPAWLWLVAGVALAGAVAGLGWSVRSWLTAPGHPRAV